MESNIKPPTASSRHVHCSSPNAASRTSPVTAGRPTNRTDTREEPPVRLSATPTSRRRGPHRRPRARSSPRAQPDVEGRLVASGLRLPPRTRRRLESLPRGRPGTMGGTRSPFANARFRSGVMRRRNCDLRRYMATILQLYLRAQVPHAATPLAERTGRSTSIARRHEGRNCPAEAHVGLPILGDLSVADTARKPSAALSAPRLGVITLRVAASRRLGAWRARRRRLPGGQPRGRGFSHAY